MATAKKAKDIKEEPLEKQLWKAADLTFATLAAAMVMPDGYGVKFPAISQLPDQMGDRIEALRGTAAGQFVFRLYQEYDRAR
jgi:hypothetical protein